MDCYRGDELIYTLYLVDDNSNITETISLDVVNSFGEDYSSNIAQNTVENGYVISDSISISNPKFSIAGVITDSKFRVRGQLVVFNGNTFVKSQGDNRDQFQTISDDDYAEKVKDRLIKLWENKEIFGILESTNINNIRGTKVRDIFPCVLSNLGFNKSDAASALYPTMSIERIRYAVVTTTTVKNPTPELVPRYEADKMRQSEATSVNVGVKSDEKGSDPVTASTADAKAMLGNLAGEAPKKAAEIKLSTEYAIKDSYTNAINGTKISTATGADKIDLIHRRAEENFNRLKAEGKILDPNAKFSRRPL